MKEYGKMKKIIALAAALALLFSAALAEDLERTRI